jgi:hypothetical protein
MSETYGYWLEENFDCKEIFVTKKYKTSFICFFIFWVSLCISPHVLASGERVVTTIVGVIEPERFDQTWIFLLSAGGRALRVDPSDRSNVEILRSMVGRMRFLVIEFTNLGRIDFVSSVIELPEPAATQLGSGFPIEPLLDADHTHVGRIDFPLRNYELTPQGIFNYWKSFRLRRGSQCFHRAYYWAHQLWRQTGVASNKVFMFFTGRYIRRFNYHWWFHVAPFVHDESGHEVVLDPTFMSGPVPMQEWTNNFLRNDPVCPVVKHYLGHHAQMREEWCYVVKTSMRDYHPNTIEQSNRTGIRVRRWDPGWLANARRSR